MKEPTGPNDAALRVTGPGPIVQSVTIGFRVIFVVVLLLAALWLGSNFRVISPDSQAVVMRFGAIVRTQKAGLLVAWPRPFEEVLTLPGPDRQLSHPVTSLPMPGGISLASLSSDSGAGALPKGASPYLTGDGKVVLLDATLIYRIADPVTFVLAQDHVTPAVDRMFRAAAVQVAAGQKLNDFLVADPTEAAAGGQTIGEIRGAVRDRLLNAMNDRLRDLSAQGPGLGVEIDRIDMTAWLPPAAKMSFDSVLTATQEADQKIAIANTQSELRRQVAQQTADRLLSTAQAAAAERTAAAKTDVASITAIEQAAGNARTGLMQQAYRNGVGTVLGKAGTVIVVDPQSGQHVLMTGPNKPTKPGQQ
jgi:regulator of protease activity HflC (stomatin/prohibitin superfamily)